MSVYTKEEWVAVGFTAGVYDELGAEWFADLLRKAWVPGHVSSHCLAMRLALAHPERAAEALGPGWEVMTGSAANGRAVFVWCAAPDIGDFELWVRDGGVALVVNEEDQVFELSPEFDAALPRARKIAKAWQAMSEGIDP